MAHEICRRLQVNPEDDCASIQQARIVSDCVLDVVLPLVPAPNKLILTNPWAQQEFVVDLDSAHRMKFNSPINDAEGYLVFFNDQQILFRHDRHPLVMGHAEWMPPMYQSIREGPSQTHLILYLKARMHKDPNGWTMH